MQQLFAQRRRVFRPLLKGGRAVPALGAFIASIIIILIAAYPVRAASTNLSYFKPLDTIKKVIEIIKSDYVEENIDEQQLIYGAVEGILKKLDDPYTRFMEPKSFKEMQVETQGEFGGIGIVITVKKRVLTVISPIDDTPAAKAGIKSGDMIVKIDGKDVVDIALHDAVRLLRGPVGTPVTITVISEGDKSPRDVNIVREIIKLPSVKYWVIKPNIGYIRLTQFIQTTAEDVEKALIDLQKNKVTSVILDLRNNPGGLLTSSVEVARKFIPKGDIVSIKGRDGEKSTYSSFFKSHPVIPMVVLINEGSASASEIVAGAIKDNKRGVLLGKKSFGKGSVQTVISLTDGSAMALTTALYYTPSGVNIHKTGIQPDIEVELPTISEKEREEVAKIIEEEEKKKKELESASTTVELTPTQHGDKTENASDTFQLSGFIEPPDSFSKGSLQTFIINKYDTQLQRAVDILKSTDIFLPILQN